MSFKHVLHASWSDRWSRWMVAASLILIGLECVGIWRWFPRQHSVAPLHYTIYFGINLTGQWYGIYTIPTIGFLAVVTHLVIGQLVGHTMWRRMWIFSALVINLIALADLAAILYLLRSTFLL